MDALKKAIQDGERHERDGWPGLVRLKGMMSYEQVDGLS